MTGPRRLAAERLPDPRPGAVLRRHLLAAGAARRHAELPPGARGGRRPVARAPRRGGRGGVRTLTGAARRRRDPRALGRAGRRPDSSSTRSANAAPAASTRATAGFGGAPEVPAPLRARAARGARRARDGRRRRCARWRAAASATRSAAASRATRSTRTWTVPHFEKMLYDNALLARAYLHAWQDGGEPLFERTCRETLDFCLRELAAPDGGFYSSLDADSEGVEGRFYVWTRGRARGRARASSRRRRSPTSARARAGTSRAPTCSRRTGPSRPSASRSARCCSRRARARVRPPLDDKRLSVLERADDRRARRRRRRARRGALPRRRRSAAAEFLWERLRDGEGRLLRSFNHGAARLPAYLEDHAFLLEALLTLYEATFDERWFEWARELADTILERFADRAARRLLRHRRRRRAADHAPQGPRGSADPVGLLERRARPAAARGADRRARLRGGGARRDPRSRPSSPPRYPTAFGHLLCAIDFHTGAVAGARAGRQRPRRAARGRARAPPAASGRARRRRRRRGQRGAAARGPRRGRGRGDAPTSASASPARRRSASRTRCARCSTER